ncbi:hypothetical protein [Sphingomonas sp. MMS24-J13]|uniref:hypothetical protein n=1 Tax=Sphingomonas sp. MMS24-J13 TaxID=3238686 RepID=UPI00385053F5
MKLNRRQAVTAGAIAPFALAQAAVGQTIAAGQARIFHVFATPDGKSHIEKVPVPPMHNKPLPVESVVLTVMEPGVEDWHHAPFKTFTINLQGNIRAEMADGSSEAIGPGDLVYLEDLTGKGHVTHLLTRVTCFFLQMPADFELKSWLAG